MWLIIFRVFLVLAIVFCCIIGYILVYALVTNKKYREEAWEDLKRRSREREPKWDREDTEYYRRTGKRHFLGRDHRDD